MIPVSKTFLPPKEELLSYIEKIYTEEQITNNGPLVKKLEKELKHRLGVRHLFLVGNATIGLQISINVLELENGSEILNSAFSFVAAPSAIISNNCRPIFVDIDPLSFCMSPENLRAKITPKSGAILPTHLFNTSCDTEAIHNIAVEHRLPIIYDAAHSFGIKINGESIFCKGDISVCSLHALKIYSMGEGGFIATNRDDLAEKIYESRYFGMNEDYHYKRIGFNGKASEFHAALGLTNLPYFEKIKYQRQKLYMIYQEELKSAPLRFQNISPNVTPNYSYIPIVLNEVEARENVEQSLKNCNIATKRYFYPSLNKLTFYNDSSTMVNSENLAERIICLPLYYGLKENDIQYICDIINKALKKGEYL